MNENASIRFRSDIGKLLGQVSKPPCLETFLETRTSAVRYGTSRRRRRTPNRSSIFGVSISSRSPFSVKRTVVLQIVNLVREALQLFEHFEPSVVDMCGLGVGLLPQGVLDKMATKFSCDSHHFFYEGGGEISSLETEVAYISSDRSKREELYIATDRRNHLTYLSCELRRRLRNENPVAFVFDTFRRDDRLVCDQLSTLRERSLERHMMLRHCHIKIYGDVLQSLRHNLSPLFDESTNDLIRVIFLCSLSKMPHLILPHHEHVYDGRKGEIDWTARRRR